MNLNDTEKWVISILRGLTGGSKSFGKVLIDVQAGKVVNVNDSRNQKPPAGKRIKVSGG